MSHPVKIGLSWATIPASLGAIMVIFGIFNSDGVRAAKGVLLIVLLGVPVFLLGTLWGYIQRWRQ